MSSSPRQRPTELRNEVSPEPPASDRMKTEVRPTVAVGAMVSADTVALRVEGLVKNYKIYHRPVDMLKELVTRHPYHTTHRALDHVTFTVRRGEVVGVIGRNGAGKSTLLKVLTGVVDYDAGSVKVKGHVNAILELGAGFNPEYSGRENVIFGGVCRGESRAEMTELLPTIVDFAELWEVIDQPFKTYSSGMQARLLFSTVIHLEADILIIDEALAAGDVLFQEKCLRRMREIATSGKTVFFVSHSMGMIQQLCTRGMLLHEGRLVLDGDTSNVAHEYDLLIGRARVSQPAILRPDPTYVTGESEEARPELKAYVATLDVVDASGSPVATLYHGRQYKVREVVVFNEDIDGLSVGFRLHLPSGLVCYAMQTVLQEVPVSGRAGDTIEVGFAFECRLAAGQYLLSGGIAEILKMDGLLANAPFAEIHIRNNVRVLSVVAEKRFGGLFDLGASVTVDPVVTPSVE